MHPSNYLDDVPSNYRGFSDCMTDLRDEHVFYNPVFSVMDDDSDDIQKRTLKPFRGNLVLEGIRTYGELVDAATSLPDLRLRAAVRRKLDSIRHVRGSVLADEIVGHDHKSVEFKLVTQKFIYSQLVHQKSVDHGYQARWHGGREDLDLVLWDSVWDSLQSPVLSGASGSPRPSTSARASGCAAALVQWVFGKMIDHFGAFRFS